MSSLKDLTMRCKKDNDFEFNRNVEYSCGCKFTISKNDIYSINYPNYAGEEKKQYYTICPNCGYINVLDENMLTEEEKVVADMERIQEPFQYQKNNLRSELIYLERISPKKLIRTR